MAEQPDAMLVVERGIEDVSVLPLDRDTCVLGKAPSADIVIDNPYVSRQHAQITWAEGNFSIRDVGSKNGTFINGDILAGKTRQLHSGDRVELGKGQVVVRFQEWGTTVTLPPTPQAASGDLVVDARSREVWLRGNKVEPPFSRKEFDVLNLLFRRRGEACSKDDIAATGWPEREEGDVGDQDIEQYIRRLRTEPVPSHPQYILTVRGFGYRLSEV